MYCLKCGCRLKDEAKFCAACGSPVFHDETAEPEAMQMSGEGETLGKISAIAAAFMFLVLTVFTCTALAAVNNVGPFEYRKEAVVCSPGPEEPLALLQEEGFFTN